MPVSATLALSYGNHPRQCVDVFVPDNATNALICCIGSGWWTDGRAEAQRGFALLLAERGMAVANLGHRPLGDGASHGGDVIDDLLAAVAKAQEEASVLGHGVRSVALLGHGSGSLAALLVAARLPGQPARAAIACSLVPTLVAGAGVASARQGDCDRFAVGRHKEWSPTSIEPTALPPLLVLHGDGDQEVPLAVARAFQERQVAAGETAVFVAIAGAGHAFTSDALSRHAAHAADRVVAFLAEFGREPQAEGLFSGCKS